MDGDIMIFIQNHAERSAIFNTSLIFTKFFSPVLHKASFLVKDMTTGSSRIEGSQYGDIKLDYQDREITIYLNNLALLANEEITIIFPFKKQMI
jgi:hypothetical protein